MTHLRRTTLLLLLLALLAAGCATRYGEGAAAYRQGDYIGAVNRFEEALAEEPGRVDALVGLGLSRYRLGAYDEAVEPLARAVEQAPADATAQLYLGLAHLRRGDDARAQDHLASYLALAPAPRTAAQVDRALGLLRGGLPPGDDVRAFVASSLEGEAGWAQELSFARQRVRQLEIQRLYDDRPYYVIHRCRC